MSVLVSTGLGLPAEDWDAVGHALARLNPSVGPFVVVDRLGPRAVDPASVRRGGLLPPAQVDRLTAAAVAAHAPPPYVIVGHSLGGLYAEAFARLRPHDVSGIVLVDADLPPRAPHSPRLLLGRPTWLAAGEASASSSVLRIRAVGAAGPVLRRAMVWAGTVGAVDPLTPARRRELYEDARTLVGMLDEHLIYRDLGRALAGLARDHPLPDVPISLIAAARWGRPLRIRNVSWIRDESQRASSLRADLVVADNAAHLVMLDEPELIATTIAKVATP
jgi:pimeloyl-ACP methyl ester carboxylesterase